MKMFVKGISKEDFWRIVLGDCPTIHVGGAHELFRRVIQQIRLGELSNILPKLGSVFSRTNNFCFEN